MIRRQSLNSLYLYLSEKAAADYIKLSQQRERERVTKPTKKKNPAGVARVQPISSISFVSRGKMQHRLSCSTALSGYSF